jgi:hypothetical protein
MRQIRQIYSSPPMGCFVPRKKEGSCSLVLKMGMVENLKSVCARTIGE